MPTSYQAPKRGDKNKPHSHSQSTDMIVPHEAATVRKLLDQKGKDLFSIRPQDTIKTAVTILRDKRIGALMVTDATGALQGILSERDIVRKLADTPGQTLPQSVAENMTSDVQTCALDDPLVTVIKRMNEGRFRHMPVLEDGVLCGMISIGDLVSYRLRELEHEALQLKQMIVG
ncbi:CBS domain-containing protein [Aliiroseovarius sp. KMU-50]|uniref:CBS domain-containing protein n=1 Tax=Aliiroseovarius salicola TaxID=3009082 RepID=A0ABT4W456_9RHOB|nr:CBS domain-containing protein [Aliiroseovarius sp. KMU-50]MDA5095310.1 CBS domain-containing protein [Aliiroseovarius sp. KMU-50]